MPSGPKALEAFDLLITALVWSAVKVEAVLRLFFLRFLLMLRDVLVPM